MAPSSTPVALGLGGIAAVLLTSGLTGNSIGDIFQGNFGSIPKTSSLGDGSGTPPTQSGGISTGSQVQAGGNSPAAIIRMIDWCNSVSGRYPYTWGGGHAVVGRPNPGPCCSSCSGLACNGFDCSGAVSGALHAGGFLGSSATSGTLASWGDSGEGQYVTVYANPTHTFMKIEGHAFGTGDDKQSKRGGVAWGNYDANLSKYSVRHPRGY